MKNLIPPCISSFGFCQVVFIPIVESSKPTMFADMAARLKPRKIIRELIIPICRTTPMIRVMIRLIGKVMAMADKSLAFMWLLGSTGRVWIRKKPFPSLEREFEVGAPFIQIIRPAAKAIAKK